VSVNVQWPTSAMDTGVMPIQTDKLCRMNTVMSNRAELYIARVLAGTNRGLLFSSSWTNIRILVAGSTVKCARLETQYY